MARDCPMGEIRRRSWSWRWSLVKTACWNNSNACYKRDWSSSPRRQRMCYSWSWDSFYSSKVQKSSFINFLEKNESELSKDLISKFISLIKTHGEETDDALEHVSNQLKGLDRNQFLIHSVRSIRLDDGLLSSKLSIFKRLIIMSEQNENEINSKKRSNLVQKAVLF